MNGGGNTAAIDILPKLLNLMPVVQPMDQLARVVHQPSGIWCRDSGYSHSCYSGDPKAMKAHVLHPQPIKKLSPLEGGLCGRDVASFLGSALLDRSKQGQNGFRDRDRESLGYPALWVRERDCLMFKVNAVAWDRAFLESRSSCQSDFKTNRHPTWIIWKSITNFINLFIGKCGLHFFGS